VLKSIQGRRAKCCYEIVDEFSSSRIFTPVAIVFDGASSASAPRTDSLVRLEKLRRILL
jgi:hypothetical protein